MAEFVTIAIDGMGGDRAPFVVMEGLARASERHPDLRFLVFGQESILRPFWYTFPILEKSAVLCAAEEVVTGSDKPSTALRTKKQSSMRLAIDAVAAGRAAGVVSAGNTGAYMAMAKFVLKTLPGIDRPAIASLFPTLSRETVMLDLGANTEANAENLVQFALMGEIFARHVLGLRAPTVGLLNVGVEEMKGHSAVREAAHILRNCADLSFHGYVEGNDVARGTTDVIVTDGFTGNIALKAIEGTAELSMIFVRQSFKSSWFARLGYLFARKALGQLRERLDPRRYNGAMFLGLNGVAVKSHGGTDAMGFAYAVGVARELIVHGFQNSIEESLLALQVKRETLDERE